MCLVVSKNSIIQCAETEVECWKVLVMKDEGKLYSPFMDCRYTVGEEKTIEGNESLMPYYYNGRVIVTHGLHTYANYGDAVLNATFYTKTVLVRCVIPVGAKYVEGTIDNIWAERGYVSDRLKIIEIVS